jgi:hypothetical protein
MSDLLDNRYFIPMSKPTRPAKSLSIPSLMNSPLYLRPQLRPARLTLREPVGRPRPGPPCAIKAAIMLTRKSTSFPLIFMEADVAEPLRFYPAGRRATCSGLFKPWNGEHEPLRGAGDRRSALRAIVSADSVAVAMLRMILNIPGRTGRGASVFPSHAPGRHPVLQGERRILA